MKKYFLIIILVLLASSSLASDKKDYAFARHLFDNGLYSLAYESLVEFVEQYPDSPYRNHAYFLQGESLFKEEKYEEAFTKYEELTDILKNTSYKDWCELRKLECLAKLNDTRAALMGVEKLYKSKLINTVFLNAKLFEANLLREVSGPKISKPVLQDIISASPSWKRLHEAYHYLGRNALVAREYIEASTSFAAAITHIDTRLTGASESQKKELVHWLEIDKSYEIECLYYLGQYSDAISSATNFIESYPESSELGRVQLRLSDSYLELGKFPESRDLYTKIISEYSNAPPPENLLSFYARLGIARVTESEGKQELTETVTQELIHSWEKNPLITEKNPYYLSAWEAFTKAHLYLGHLLERRNKWGVAYTIYTAALERNPDSSLAMDLILRQAWTQFKLENYGFSKNILSQILSSSPDIQIESQARELMARYNQHKQDFTEMKSDLLHLESLVDTPLYLYRTVDGIPFRYKIPYSLGIADLNLGNATDAIRYFKSVAETPGAPRNYKLNSWNYIGNAAYALADYPASVTAYQTTLEIIMDKPYKEWLEKPLLSDKEEDFILISDALWGVASACFNLKDWKESVHCYSMFGTLFPNSGKAPESFYLAGLSRISQNNFSGAVTLFENVIEKYPNSYFKEMSQIRLGWCLKRDNKLREALDPLTVVLNSLERGRSNKPFAGQPSINDLAAQARYMIAQIYFQRKNYFQSISAYNTLISKYPDIDYADRVLLNMGDAYYNIRRYSKSVEFYNRILDDYPGSELVPESYVSLGWAYYAAGDLDKAMKVWDTLLSRYPDNPIVTQVLFTMGDLSASKSDYTSAVTYWQALIDRFPQSENAVQALYRIGQAEASQNNHAQAVIAWTWYLAKDPPPARKISTRLNMGHSQEYIGQWEGAIKSYRLIYSSTDSIIGATAPAMLSYRLESQMGAARCFKKLNKTDVSKNLLEKVVAESEEGSTIERRALLDLADLYLTEGKYESALKSYQEILKYEFGDQIESKAQFNYGLCLKESGDLKSAIPELVKVSVLYKTNPEMALAALFEAGKIYEKLRQWKDSQEIYKKALAIGLEGNEITQMAAERLHWIETNFPLLDFNLPLGATADVTLKSATVTPTINQPSSPN